MLGGSGSGSGDGETVGDATSGGSSGGGGNTSPPGEGIFLNMLRRLENVDVAGEDSPRTAAAAAAAGSGGGSDGSLDGRDEGGGSLEGEGRGGAGSRWAEHDQEERAAGGGGVGSSFAGVGAKLRSKFRKPVGGQTGGTAGGGAAEGVGEGGKAFVEGASKALAANRERVMGWMKELRPKDWSPKEAERKGW